MKKLRITVGNKTYDVTVEVLSDETPARIVSASSRAAPSSVQVPQGSAPSAPQAPIGSGAVLSPLAGVVKSVFVKKGDTVEKSQELLILEAMKMENRITAPVAGTVKEVKVAEGESVPEGHVLLVVE